MLSAAAGLTPRWAGHLPRSPPSLLSLAPTQAPPHLPGSYPARTAERGTSCSRRCAQSSEMDAGGEAARTLHRQAATNKQQGELP